MSVDVEHSVVGLAVSRPEVVPEILSKIQPTDLWDPKCEAVLGAVVGLWGDGIHGDALGVVQRLSGSQVTAGDVFGMVEAACVPAALSHHLGTISERASVRRLGAAGQRIVTLAQAGETSQSIAQQAQELLDGAVRTSEADTHTIAETIPTALERIQAAARGETQSGLPTGFADLDEILNGLSGGQMIVVAARPGAGKALALDTPLATPDGWTTMGDVKVGDFLFGPDGQPTRVTAATEVMHGRTCYMVEFSDGSNLIADAEHLWVTHDRKERRYHREPSIRTTHQIKETLRTETADRRLNHSIRNTSALQGENRDYLISPYTLGVWLGDGHSDSARYTTPDEEVAANVRADGYISESYKGDEYGWTLRLPKCAPTGYGTCAWCGGQVSDRSNAACLDCYRNYSTIQGRLRVIGVLGNKHIPQEYLRGSEGQRRALLAGLMDTDGTVGNGGAYQFAVTSEPLAKGACELISSLGYRYGMSTKRVKGSSEKSSTCYTITFSTPHEIFRLSRKQQVHAERYKAVNTARSGSRYITAVEEVESVPVKCIQVDNQDRMYLAGRNMVPTHNTTLATDFMRHASIKLGVPSLMFSLEMGEDELTTRILSAEGGLNVGKLISGGIDEQDQQRLTDTAERIKDAPIHVDAAGGATITEVVAKGRLFAEHKNVGLIVVDYLQLLRAENVFSREQEIASYSRAMKLLAKQTGVPVVVVAQLNREQSKRGGPPKISDIRESGAIEQDADVVLLLDRPEVEDAGSARAGEMDVIVAKNRRGRTGTVTLVSQLHYSRFANMARV